VSVSVRERERGSSHTHILAPSHTPTHSRPNLKLMHCFFQGTCHLEFIYFFLVSHLEFFFVFLLKASASCHLAEFIQTEQFITPNRARRELLQSRSQCYERKFSSKKYLCTTTILGTTDPLLTSGRCESRSPIYQDLKMTVVIIRWSLFGGSR